MYGRVVIIADYPNNFPLNVPPRDFNEIKGYFEKKMYSKYANVVSW